MKDEIQRSYDEVAADYAEQFGDELQYPEVEYPSRRAYTFARKPGERIGR